MKIEDMKEMTVLSREEQQAIRGGFGAALLQLGLEAAGGFLISKTADDTIDSIAEETGGTIDMDVVGANVLKGANRQKRRNRQ